ncbi:MAG: dimethylmenaquinone methyltransferase [Planctomycetota bacterium]|nr:MAG: dimethylmenaquinone methyltransferase [Planctomycetota bacterium]
MFAGVARRYDFLNRSLSVGVDTIWRRRTVKRALRGRRAEDTEVLDLCTGTGDLALAFAQQGCAVLGLDFCPEMVVLGEEKRQKRLPKQAKLQRLRFGVADAQALPLPNDAYDVATVAFGIRNVQNPLRGLRELARVLRPGGLLLVLEFARPRTPVLGPLYLWYFRHILPKLGKLLSPGSRDHDAYGYLPESVMSFPEREGFTRLMQEAGLEDCRYTAFHMGIAALYQGRVPGEGR